MATSLCKGSWTTELDIDSESDAGSRSIFSEEDPGSSATELESDDPEAEEIRQSIAFHQGQGRAKTRRKETSESLITREFERWAVLADVSPSFYDIVTNKDNQASAERSKKRILQRPFAFAMLHCSKRISNAG